MGPSVDDHSPIANSSIPNSCDDSGAPEHDAKINSNTMSSAFDTRPPSAPSTSNLPMTQITNNGGTININYNIHTAPGLRQDKGKVPAVGKGEGTIHTERDPDLTSPLSPNTESSNAGPSSAKSSNESCVTPEETVARHTEPLPHKKSHGVWAISDNEKAEVRHSIELMLLGSISRKELSNALMDLSQAMVLIDDDEGQCANVPIQLGTDPSSVDPDRVWSTGLIIPNPFSESIANINDAIEEREPVQAPVNCTPIPPTNESLQHECSGLRLNAPPACQAVPSSQHDVSAGDSSKSDVRSSGMVEVPMNDTPPSPSASAQGKSLQSGTLQGSGPDLIYR